MAEIREPDSGCKTLSNGSDKGAPGLTVLGTEAGCGKTVVTTGLTALLQEEQFKARAIKPISIGDRKECQTELFFMSSIARSPLDYPLHTLDRAGALNSLGWAEALNTCRGTSETTLLELPGSCATALTGIESDLKDNADFARELGWPCLLVAREGPDVLEKLLLNTVYLHARKLKVIALVTVETGADFSPTSEGHNIWEVPEITLQERTGVPFIGCLKYSASISVPRGSQGNIIKTTSASLDLLAIIKALDLRISV